MLFTDIEGSTLLLQQLGERYAEMLATCRQLLRTAFQQWNGFEVDTQGDSFFVVFARASDAVSAVVDMQRALARHDWPGGAAVALRIGLHTGEPTHTAEGYIGMDVHHAARVMSAGHGGQVLLSQTTRDLVEHDLPTGVSLRELGSTSPQGLTAEEPPLSARHFRLACRFPAPQDPGYPPQQPAPPAHSADWTRKGSGDYPAPAGS